jgi:hypothetical protein
MILPQGHYNETRKPTIHNRRERWVFGIGGALIAIVVAATIFSLTSHQGKSGHGCLNFTYSFAMGGEQLDECGAKARQLCASPPSLGGLGKPLAAKLKVECRKARLPYMPAA